MLPLPVKVIATNGDLQNIEKIVSRPVETLEANNNAHFVVYAAANRDSEQYCLALQKELQESLCEGLVLIERQEVLLL